MKPEYAAVISGIGRSRIGRHLDVDPWLLTAESALAAISDAGLQTSDIDGLATYPGALWYTAGITGAGVDDVRALLGLDLRWYTGGGEVPGQLGAIVNAVMAVACGLADHVLCFRTVWESTAQDGAGNRASALLGSSDPAQFRFSREAQQWTVPFGIGYPCYAGMLMQRYMELSGSTREQFAQIAVVARSYAAGNDAAVYRTPLTIDDYLAARMMSDPACIYDCDVPVDGSVAFVLSRSDLTEAPAARAVRIEAVGSASGFERSSEMMWSRTDLKPADVDVAQLYDGFSIYAIRWLEALGFCAKNEGAAFVDGGERIGPLGDLPMNTGGGQLSGGRLHGYGGLFEACLQLRQEGADRQIPGSPEVAVVSSGAEKFTSCLLLTR